MLRTAKMELLRTLVSERLSAVAQEIYKIVERTIMEYEEEMSCSKWAVDSHCRLQDVAKSQSEESLQMCATDVKLHPASMDVSTCREPENTTEPREDCPNVNNIHPDCSPASENDCQSDQEMLIDVEDVDVKQESDLNSPLKKLFKCPVCCSGFPSKKKMVQHFKKHPEDKSWSYQCQFCPRRFCNKSEFIIHTRTHQSQGDSLLIHRGKHAEEKPHQCFSESGVKTIPLNITPYDKSEFDQESLQPLCLYQIQTVADIDKAAAPVNHIKTEPVETDCGVSNSTADDLQLRSLNQGEQRETEPKLFNTESIPQRQVSGKSSELIVQFEAGTAQKPYKCPCCTKCFSLTKTLIRHLKIHTEDKPYQCQFCGRNFCQKSDLVNHTRIHTGERPYQCPECHKSFAQKGNLVVHMRKHTGEKPYQCRECSCSFDHKTSLEFHMQRHT
uniref:zinc finger protein 300-like n=1 Tax=Semicossyphus pulcher TaxID=241346 RepID=UPI0037E9698A